MSKARERIYFANKSLVELFKQNNPDVIMTRFVSTESDVTRDTWLGYEISYQDKSETQPDQSSQTNVPTIA